MDTTPAAHAIGFAAIVAWRGQVGHGFGAFATIGLPGLVHGGTFGTGILACKGPFPKIRLDLPGGIIAFVWIFLKVDPD